ncbi:hypothetical protein GP486_006727 [Trichoglossum hirsutum]|uniref:Uncharacterized protein n=1 Tax=Trichoglossum hirsutum TaxID=265104 RepID=A0A9P8IIX3_9PEZI|nr:hypothetical protein GP486_006727 [Trichoglossum hirsutum]
MTALEKDTFPRVTKVILYLGQYYPQLPTSGGHEPLVSSSPPNPIAGNPPLHTAVRGVHTMRDQQSRSRACCPNAPFWRSLFNGDTFPDCSSVEIHHFRAAPSLQPETLADISSFQIPPVFPHVMVNVKDLGELAGLGKIYSLVLEFVPELNDSILMASLSRAASLRVLELRYCNLSPTSLAKLLPHALPNLSKFTLLISSRSMSARDIALSVDESVEGDERASYIPHLCPLIREFSKNLTHLEFANPYICREIFVDNLEMRKIEEAGVSRTDRFAIGQVLVDFRKQKEDKRRKLRIAEAVAESKAKSRSTGSNSLFGRGVSGERKAEDTAREMERALDDEQQKRIRLIKDTKEGWDRRIVCWHGLCRRTDPWEEIEEEASLEEEGVRWTIANGKLKQASRHLRGQVRIDLDYGEEVYGKPTTQLTPEDIEGSWQQY